MNIFRRAARLVTQNFGWKILAVAIAVAIWALVASEPELSTFSTVSLEYRNLPDDLEIRSLPAREVTLELRGPAGELRGSGENRRPAVILDMSNVTAGQRTFPIGDGDVSLPRGVHLVRAIPSEVRFEFDRRLARAVPVHVRFAEPGAGGYVVGNYGVSPDHLVIVGPAHAVSRIQAVETDEVDVSSAVATAQFRVNAYMPDATVRFESSPQVTVSVTMRKK